MYDEIDSPFNVQSENFKNYFNYILINLKIIQTLNIYDKVRLKDNNITIDTSNIFQCVLRWWNYSDRAKELQSVHFFINKTIDIYKDLKTQAKARRINNVISSKTGKRLKIINEYINIIDNHRDNIINGLKNFKKTYETDIKMTRPLDLMITHMSCNL